MFYNDSEPLHIIGATGAVSRRIKQLVNELPAEPPIDLRARNMAQLMLAQQLSRETGLTLQESVNAISGTYRARFPNLAAVRCITRRVNS